MKKTLIRLTAAAAALTLLTALAGCLKFENTLDINTPAGHEGGTGNTPSYTQESTTLPTAPTDATVPTSLPEESTTLPTESTTAPAESTTAPGQDTASTTAAAPQSAADYIRALGATEYDTLRSNNCSIVASIESGGERTPVELSIAPDKLYVVSEMDGLQMGIYVEGKKTYIYLPKQKSYLKLSNAIANLIGLKPSEFTDMAADLGFDKLPPLSNATKMEDVNFEGLNCKRFTVPNGEETVRVYLYGKKLVAMDYINASGQIGSVMRFDSVTAGFPALPPSDYSEISYIDFAKLIMAEMDQG